MLKRLHSQTITDLSAAFRLPEGLYRGIFATFDGTNQSGQQLTSANLGSFRLTKDGREKMNFTVEQMVDAVNIKLGKLEEASTAGGTFRHAVYIPFHHWLDSDTAMIVRPGDEFLAMFDFPAATSTVVASGTLTVYAVLADPNSVTPYEVQFRMHNITAGASGIITQLIKSENISGLFVENKAGLERVSVRRDGELWLSNVARDDIYSWTHVMNPETAFNASTPLMDIDLNNTGDPVGALSNSVELELDLSSAGTFKVLVMSIFPTPKKQIASLQRRDVELNNQELKKARTGADAAVQVIQSEKVG